MHFSNMRLMGVLVIAGLALAALPARAAFDTGLINVDFNGGIPLSPTYNGAAVVGSAGDTWNAFGGPNYVGGASASGAPLVLSDNTPSAVTLSYSTPDGFYDAAGNSNYAASPYAALLRDQMVTNRNGIDGLASVSFGGLTPGGNYTLILYSGGSDAVGRDSRFTVDGVTQDTVAGTSNTLVAGENYVSYDATADAAGGLSFTFTSVPNSTFTNFDGDLSGIQLAPQASPEPAALSLLALCSAALLKRGRRIAV
jgi:hypothetical protein